MTNPAGYENAPATKMLATHCACCGRPLVDAVSVETGMGPDCRRKYGYDAQVNEADRAQANRLVYAIACQQRGLEVAVAACSLRALGFSKLADKVLERTADVFVEDRGDVYFVRTPYLAEACPAWRQVHGVWDGEAKARKVPRAARMQLWGLLCRFFAGRVCVTGKQALQIPGGA